MNNFETYVNAHLDSLRLVSDDSIASVLAILHEAQSQEKIVWLAGNGGSASTASHAQCDLAKGVLNTKNLKARFISLMDSTPTLTAWANDYGYDSAIENLCKNYLQTGDVLFLVSGSGNSKNILNALRYAKSINVKVVGLSGFDGGQLRKEWDAGIHVNSNDMQVVENIHLMLIHWLFKSF